MSDNFCGKSTYMHFNIHCSRSDIFFLHLCELVLIFSFIYSLVGNSVFKLESGRGAAIRDLKMRGRRREVKRRLQSEFAVFQSSFQLFHLAFFVECTRIRLELNS